MISFLYSFLENLIQFQSSGQQCGSVGLTPPSPLQLPHPRDQAFNNLATEKGLRQQLIEQGVVPVIIGLACSSKSNVLLLECVETLCKLAAVPGSEALIIAQVTTARAFSI